jgi:hypothetical protein
MSSTRFETPTCIVRPFFRVCFNIRIMVSWKHKFSGFTKYWNRVTGFGKNSFCQMIRDTQAKNKNNKSNKGQINIVDFL